MQGDSKFKVTGKADTCLTSDQLLKVPKYVNSPIWTLSIKGLVTLESRIRGKLPASVLVEAIEASPRPSFKVTGVRSLITTKGLEIRPVTLVRIAAVLFLEMVKYRFPL